MKNWNAPEVKELNINETANGWSNSGKESTWVDDADHSHGVQGGEKPGDWRDENPVTPDTLS